MTTFHPFPLLPLELRIQIWTDAFHSIVLNRVLTIRKRRTHDAYSSPTPPPALINTCRESRKYTGDHYQKCFTVEGSPQYIWANLSTDIIFMNGALMNSLARGTSREINEIRHLQLELVHNFGWDDSSCFRHNYSYRIFDFPALKTCDVLVKDGLYAWAKFARKCRWENRWCKGRGDVRIVDEETGEWIDAANAGAYKDWVDTDHGANRDFDREDWDRNWEDEEERYEKMMEVMSSPLPRIDLGSRGILIRAEAAVR
jgi:hypothetical protein